MVERIDDMAEKTGRLELQLLSAFCLVCLLLVCLLLACLHISVYTKTQPLHHNVDLEAVLKNALKQRRHYIDTFRNLTADETKITEVFDDDGRLQKQRKQLAHFLVLQSQLDSRSINEYRFIREVDGKPVNNQLEHAEKLFNQLASARSLESELKRLREENMRYTVRYYRWDITLHPAKQLEEDNWPEYDYEIVERGQTGEREVIVLRYRRKSLYPAKAKGILSAFKDPHVGDQGRLWLDAITFQLHRLEDERLVRHAETGKMLVYLRDEVEYDQSELGILVPKRIVVSFFDKLRYKAKESEEPRTLLRGWITYTYVKFSRFKVTSQEEFDSIKKD